MSRCPTCGQEIVLTEPERVLAILRDRTQGRRRDIYKGQDGNWYITQGGGKVADETVQKLVSSRRVVRTYDECDDSFTVGKTMAVKATAEARRNRAITKSQVIYTDGSRGP